MSGLNRSVIANIESGRRKYVTVDEVFTLAYVLDVAPIHLMVPTDVDETFDVERYQPAPERFLPIPAAREWTRGGYCPPGVDPRVYYAEVPRDEWRPPQPSGEEITEHGERIQRHRETVARVKPDQGGGSGTH